MSSYDCENGNNDSLAARLNKRVTVYRQPTDEERAAAPKDQFNQPIVEPIPVTTLWAGIEPLQGNEFFAAKRENAEVTTRIRIRYREGIDRTMTVKYKDIEFEVMYIIHPKFAKVELQLMCKERQ